MPREALGEGPFQPGQTLQGSIEQVATITKVDQDEVTVDANHPLADRTLRVSGSVVDVRDATHEEVALGRAEGQDDATMLILITMREQKEQA